MTDTIGHYLLEIVKAGGPLALWGIFIWVSLGIVRLSIVCLIVYMALKVICNTITTNYKISKEIRDSKISLISEQVSQILTKTLQDFSQETQAILKDIEKELKELKKPSKEI